MIESLNPQTAQAILVLCSVVIAICGLLTGLGFIFNMLLAPLKEKQAVFERRLDKIEAKLDKLYDLLLKANGKR